VTTALVHASPTHLARQTIAAHSKSFALASKLLGARLRDATAVVYTWCRRADDAVDELSAFSAREELLRLQRELRSVYAGTARDPVLAAFSDVVKARGIPMTYPGALLAGMEMDVSSARYQTVDDVIVYAYRVAGVVGLMMAHVFGVRDDQALVHAAHLGIAMQLTNICRDVSEDWNRGRLYVPADLLARHGATDLAGDLGKPLPDSARVPLAASVAELLQLADRYYASGAAGEHALPWRAALAVRAARGVYSAIGNELAARDHDVTAGRAVVPRNTKLARVAAATARTLVEAPWRIFRRRARVPTRTLELRDVPRL
jgi:phytoene synthase